MRYGLRYKFAPYTSWTNKLLATGDADAEIIEWNTWHDQFWGKCSCDECGGCGENYLGLELMVIREQLVKLYKPAEELISWFNTNQLNFDLTMRFEQYRYKQRYVYLIPRREIDLIGRKKRRVSDVGITGAFGHIIAYIWPDYIYSTLPPPFWG